MLIVNHHPLITINHSLVVVWCREGLVHISGTIEKRHKKNKKNKQAKYSHLCLYIYLCITEPQNKRCKRKLILNACILWDAFRFQSLCKVKIDTAPPLEIYQSTNPAGHCYWEGDAPTAYYWANCNTFLVLNVNEKDSWEIPLRKPPFWSDLGWGCYYLLR